MVCHVSEAVKQTRATAPLRLYALRRIKFGAVRVKILFFVHNLGKTRHFESVILELCRRGHSVTLAAARKRKKLLKLTGVLHAEKRIDVVPCPVHRVDRWEDHVRPLRQARDYLRFLDPRYNGAAKLSARAAEYAPPGWSAFVQRPSVQRNWRWLQRGLELAEAVTPTDRYFELFIQSERPDIVLITPLVDFGSYQTDYVKAAHRLGLPVAFLPFSWDNLTNRGLVRIAPDRTLVWNEYQQREAVEFHGVPADRVVITGAPRFDAFFTMRPATTRDAFCVTIGLDPARPLLLYLCSSNFVAPQEVDFVRRWAAAIRRAPDCILRDVSILIRPHPANAEQWEQASLSDLPGVAVWTARSEMNADQGLYDSLWHAAAAVGLNTSAMIEAGLLGRAVYTVMPPEFAGGQQQTLHFHYLLARNGGLVEVAGSIDEHLRQLSDELHTPGRRREQALRFVERFVRPHGVERPVTPIMVGEIERLAEIRKRRRLRTPPWQAAARWALLTVMDRRANRRS